MTCKTESGPIRTGVLACVAAIAMSSSAAALADGHESEKPEGDAVAAGMDLALANQLAAYGDRNNDALSLIVAANIMNGLGTIEEREGEAESEGSGEAGDDKPEEAGLLDRARELAGDDEELIALIEDAEMAGARGDIAGPGCYNDSVWSGYTDIWTITFTPGSNYISLDGDGDTDLDLYVYAPNGNLICQGLSYNDNEFCSWNQYSTATVRVEVKNLGSVYNVYDLCTN